jgi:hypothetical protein
MAGFLERFKQIMPDRPWTCDFHNVQPMPEVALKLIERYSHPVIVAEPNFCAEFGKPILTRFWLAMCAFSKDCVWSKLPKDLVLLIARKIRTDEAHRHVSVCSLLDNGLLRHRKTMDVLVFIPDDTQQSSTAFYKHIVPVVMLEITKQIIIFK